ncbi:MAG: DegV family protein [Eubacteriales bacterium]|nr:DegV family protein [Eubacteriales bacterium]
MTNTFQLSCESTVDMPFDYVSSRNMEVLFYSYMVDGHEYADDMGRDPAALARFYDFVDKGKLPSTSQINEFSYYDFFDTLLQKGDVLHLAFGTGMTPSYHNACGAAEKLREKYPNRKITVVDTLCSSSGYGLIVDTAADMRDAGAGMDEIASWVISQSKNVHHQFFSTDMTMFKRSGRVSGVTAAVASILGICPIMHLDITGHIVAYDKVRGKKNAIKKTVDEMEKYASGGSQYSGKCFISHSNCIEEAIKTRDMIAQRFPNITDMRIYDIGTIIASHCGKGTVAVYFFGCQRI